MYLDMESVCDLFLVKLEFEDGDIVIKKRDSTGCFISPYRGTNIYGGILTEVYFNVGKGTLHIQKGIVNGRGYTKDYKLATEEEKKEFFDALEKEGKRWNSEKKCIEDIKPEYVFKPFERVIARGCDDAGWVATFFSNMYNDKFKLCHGLIYKECVTFNEETKNLIGTTDDAPKKYIFFWSIS